jgi:mannose/fructose/N-acetylgalactosamine-specific phosphotransferase system component IID
MKEVLIYGALVAAVIGVSTQLITSITSSLPDKATQIQTTIDSRIDNLLNIGN